MALTAAETVDARRFCGYVGATPMPLDLIGAALVFLSVEVETVARGYVVQLRTMETQLAASSDNLDTAKAAVWEHNKDEVLQRQYLFDEWRRRFCAFLGVLPGPWFPVATAVVGPDGTPIVTPVYDPAVFLV